MNQQTRSSSITLRLGQAIPWPSSPCGIAQVDSFGRRRIRLVYRGRNGAMRFATVPARKLLGGKLLFDLQNPFDRGVIPRSKTFNLD